MRMMCVSSRQDKSQQSPPCQCQHCGACIADIDLMHKEQRKSLAIAKNPAAQRIEQAQAVLFAQLAEFDFNANTEFDQQLKQQAEAWHSEQAWNIEEEEDDEPEAREQQTGPDDPRGGPTRACMSLRDIIRAEGKKTFDKHDAARHCTWCFRKGHSSRSTNPENEPRYETRNLANRVDSHEQVDF
jgi:hypothetical protein